MTNTCSSDYVNSNVKHVHGYIYKKICIWCSATVWSNHFVKRVLLISGNLYPWDIAGAEANLETLRKETEHILGV